MTLQDHGQSIDTSSEHRRGLLITAALAAILVAVLGGWLILDDSQSRQEPVQVAGSGSCTLADDTSLICVYEMSDARVSGTETFSALPNELRSNMTPTYTPAEYPTEFILDTDEGQWIGLLANDDMKLWWCSICEAPHGEWEVEYTGTGAYEGLTYRQRVQGDDEALLIAGAGVYQVRITGTIEPRE